LLVQDIKGGSKGYQDLKPAYQVSIFGNDRFFGDNEFFHSFEYYDPERGVSLNGKTRIITLELSKLEPLADRPIDDMGNREMWAMFFKYHNDPKMRAMINAMMEREEGLAMAGELILGLSRNEAEYFRLMSEHKYEMDLQSEKVYAREEGLAEGLAKGLSKGRRQEKEDMARNALAEGFSVEVVQKITGLDPETVARLKAGS